VEGVPGFLVISSLSVVFQRRVGVVEERRRGFPPLGTARGTAAALYHLEGVRPRPHRTAKCSMPKREGGRAAYGNSAVADKTSWLGK
jgi:hypothetical protein